MNGQHARVVAVVNGNDADTVFAGEFHRPIDGDLADHHPVTVVSIEESGRAEPARGLNVRSWIDHTGRERAYVRRHSHDAMRPNPAEVGFDKAGNKADDILIGHTGEAGRPTDKGPGVSHRHGAPIVNSSSHLLCVGNQARSANSRSPHQPQFRLPVHR